MALQLKLGSESLAKDKLFFTCKFSMLGVDMVRSSSSEMLGMNLSLISSF